VLKNITKKPSWFVVEIIYNRILNYSSQKAAKKSWDRVMEGKALSSVGSILMAKGEPETALDYLHEYEELARSMDDRESLCLAYSQLSGAYESLNREDKAIELLEELVDLSQETKNPRMESEASRSFYQTPSSYNIK